MRRCLALVLPALLFAPAFAQAPVPLGWKLQSRFYAELTTSQQRRTNVQGKAVNQSKDLTLLLAVQPQARSKDGTQVVEVQVEALKLTVPGKAQSPEEQVLKLLEGVELKVTLGPDLRVRQVDGLADVVTKVAGPQAAALPAPVREAMQASFEGLLTYFLGELFVPLPNKAVGKGDRWEQTTTVRLPTFGTLALKKELTYEGKGRLPYQDKERVAATGTFSFEPAKDVGPGGVKVLQADVKTGEYKGTLHFDAAAGRLFHAEVKMKTDVVVSMLVNKKKAQGHGLQEDTLTIRTFDRKPDPK